MDQWNRNAKGVQRFLTNYMRQVKVLLIFTAATRSADWKLHLSTTEELLHYFHAHDQYNYGRWGPLYVADMLELQLTDLDIWSFLDKGNFVISKHSVPFTAIGPDHAIKQEHKQMKMKRGFIGITGNEQAMKKHFVIAPTLSRIVQEFKEYAGIDNRRAYSLHHELTSEKSSKLVRNAAKLVGNINMQGNPFLKHDMYNLMTFAVAPDDVSKDIEYRDQYGKEALQHFVSTRMVDNTVEFWGAQKKNKFKYFKYFKDVGVVMQTKIKGQLVHIKQERTLLSRLLVIAKSRPEFVVKDAIGNFEFNVAPPSNFHPDGFLIMLSSKSQLVPLIMKMSAPDGASNVVQYEENVSIRLLIIDAMCLVNMVVKTPEMTTAKQFFTKFLGIIQGMSASYDELRIVFDQYISGTLKETTRKKRSLKLAHIHYHVNDDTEIKSIKSFLAHIDTKAELTTYLSHNIISHYQGHRQKKKGNQLVLLNACDVMHKDPQSFLDVFSVDTDVFVLTGHYKLIPKSTTLIRRGSERLSIRESYLQLGQKRADALIGWYEFKGTDNTGSFAGKGVSCQFKAFLQADDDILDAFSRFGAVPEIPRIIHQQMERYTCLLYKLGDTCAEEVPELRWMLFAQKNKEGQQLPPTLGSLVPHTARAFIRKQLPPIRLTFPIIVNKSKGQSQQKLGYPLLSKSRFWTSKVL
ncbi:hypothetical protein GQR58_027738 [Nymphon striatum]|nr:hypothetical protein GQR58_027738 [Nymphon striatum]